ncbi:hypothetical protein CALVIDRAFT_337149 [Calocera viscosa TUFC12733]|uniref:Uncharacterized protein n=1 Tax=Calocera viscosa (strain TUFC12733) TaxID=1330018 RepID=A0A167HJA0_CALVF|nr:hypothetical protein CALVIDRAFT_337149 [Calocera viscosa TUFC12733]
MPLSLSVGFPIGQLHAGYLPAPRPWDPIVNLFQGCSPPPISSRLAHLYKGAFCTIRLPISFPARRPPPILDRSITAASMNSMPGLTERVLRQMAAEYLSSHIPPGSPSPRPIKQEEDEHKPYLLPYATGNNAPALTAHIPDLPVTPAYMNSTINPEFHPGGLYLVAMYETGVDGQRVIAWNFVYCPDPRYLVRYNIMQNGNRIWEATVERFVLTNRDRVLLIVAVAVPWMGTYIPLAEETIRTATVAHPKRFIGNNGSRWEAERVVWYDVLVCLNSQGAFGPNRLKFPEGGLESFWKELNEWASLRISALLTFERLMASGSGGRWVPRLRYIERT